MSKRKLLIVSGESSGELYGALLARELIQDFDLYGVGGEKMEIAGVNLIGKVTHAIGFVEVLGKLRKIRETFSEVKNFLKKVDGVILIDFPDFNLKVAKEAKKLRKRVLYYVSPQVWAWRKGRIRKIKESVDFMATILPFEEEIYRRAGIPTKFVGHPMVELLRDELGVDFKDKSSLERLKEELRRKFGLTDKIVLTMMPGSRPSEISRHMQLVEKIISDLNRKHIHFLIPLAPNIEIDERYQRVLNSYTNVTILRQSSFTALAMSDGALIKSGTSTLQATLLHIPMIVFYRVNPITYIIVKNLVKGLRHIALPNVVADFLEIDDFRIIEFIQRFDESKIIEELTRILHDEYYRKKSIDFLKRVSEHFYGKEPSKEVAKLCRELFC